MSIPSLLLTRQARRAANFEQAFMTPHRIGFLYWPGTKALTLSLAEEALRVAQRVHPEVVYELSLIHI